MYVYIHIYIYIYIYIISPLNKARACPRRTPGSPDSHRANRAYKQDMRS